MIRRLSFTILIMLYFSQVCFTCNRQKSFKLNAGETFTEFKKLKIGETVEIKLEGNPTTGYTWYIDDGKFNILAPINLSKENGIFSGLYKSDNNKNGIVGSGGVYSFKFKVKNHGQDNILIKYARIWEKNQPFSIINAKFICDK